LDNTPPDIGTVEKQIKGEDNGQQATSSTRTTVKTVRLRAKLTLLPAKICNSAPNDC
jgi:hypothetical protein